MRPADHHADRLRGRRAEAEFRAVLAALASDVIARIDERCPYRGCGDVCVFAGGCVNQRHEPAASSGGVACRDAPALTGGRTCGGDGRLREARR